MQNTDESITLKTELNKTRSCFFIGISSIAFIANSLFITNSIKIAPQFLQGLLSAFVALLWLYSFIGIFFVPKTIFHFFTLIAIATPLNQRITIQVLSIVLYVIISSCYFLKRGFPDWLGYEYVTWLKLFQFFIFFIIGNAISTQMNRSYPVRAFIGTGLFWFIACYAWSHGYTTDYDDSSEMLYSGFNPESIKTIQDFAKYFIHYIFAVITTYLGIFWGLLSNKNLVNEVS